MRRSGHAAAALALAGVCLAAVRGAEARMPARSGRGMVATASPLATQVGVGVLGRGGNAADAAVAVAFALAVVHPQGGNIGGGGFALVRDGATGAVHAIDFREVAPERVRVDTYLDARGEVIPGKSTRGIFAVGIPGSVAGMESLHDRFGSLPWASLLEPAVVLAREGFPVDWALARDLADEREKLGAFPETAAIFLPGGAVPVEGQRLRQRDLGATLERLASAGPRELYVGETARLLLEASRAHGGVLTRDDLSRYRARERRPLSMPWRDLVVHGMPLPSSGGVTLMEALNILEPYDLAALGAGGALHASAVAEACRRAFYDRARHLGDPDHVEAPVGRLLDKAYAARLRGSIVLGRPTRLPELRGQMREPEHTTHFAVADSRGNVVAVTTTINDSFGSGLVVRGAGFLLNNEMDDFALRPGAPNLYGLTGGRENAVAPGKRMLSSMAPTLVTRGGEPYLVLGARGGPRIITTVLQVLLNVHVHGMGLQDAVDFPRFHHQGQPDEMLHERHAFSPDTLDALCAMGYGLRLRSPASPMSACQAILFRDGILEGAADPRDAGSAAGP